MAATVMTVRGPGPGRSSSGSRSRTSTCSSTWSRSSRRTCSRSTTVLGDVELAIDEVRRYVDAAAPWASGSSRARRRHDRRAHGSRSDRPASRRRRARPPSRDGLRPLPRALVRAGARARPHRRAGGPLRRRDRAWGRRYGHPPRHHRRARRGPRLREPGRGAGPPCGRPGPPADGPAHHAPRTLRAGWGCASSTSSRRRASSLGRVIVGHSDTDPDPDYHEALARRGAWVEFDTVRGRFPFIGRAPRPLRPRGAPAWLPRPAAALP